MRHDAFGWWIEEAWDLSPDASAWEQLQSEALPRIESDCDAEVVIVGGGYTGMWAALRLAEEIPGEQIVVLEAGVCGTGPSGRNGGFCDSFVEAAPRLLEEHGPERAGRLVEASIRNIEEIKSWAEVEGVDIGFKQSGQLVAVAGDQQSIESERIAIAAQGLGLPSGAVRVVNGNAARGMCGSPVFREGLFVGDTATIHPGLLGKALRSALITRGVRVYELSRVSRLSSTSEGVAVSLSHGPAVAAKRGLLAAGAESVGFHGLRRETTLTSSHIVLTEPVPQLVEQIGWKDGLAVTDARYLVHYFRTTEDGRVLFGWGGGRMGFGATVRRRQSLDLSVVQQATKDLIRVFPQLAGVQIERAWGGPIDASPIHMPAIRQFSGGWVAAFGYTGNGVGPSRLCGRALADVALGSFGADHPAAPLVVKSPVRVPPEPFRWFGGNVIRAGIDRVERAGEGEGHAGLLARFTASLPDRLGYRIGR